jgi:thiol:disulfide interchange protein
MRPSRLIVVLLVSICTAIAVAQQQVVHWTASAAGAGMIELHGKIDAGWHLYGLATDKTVPNVPTEVTAVPPLRLAGKVEQPKPIHKMDPNFGAEVDYFEHEVTFKVPVSPQKIEGQKLKVHYQACNDRSCLPPTDAEVTIGASTQETAPVAATLPPTQSDEDRINAAKKAGLLSFIGLAFGAGLLALLTPCVFPMVPITVSFFAKRRETIGSRGLIDAAAYCVGIVGAFTAFGLIVTLLFGATGIRTFATNPWVNIAIGILFVGLALNLFGYYSLALPSGLANKFSPQGKAGIVAPILMGLTFTITSFTCTVPFIGTILVSATTGELLYPVVGMLAFGTAFCLPFFFLALFPQFLASMPKSGLWLEAVKGFMGFLEIAAAIKFFSNADLVWNEKPWLPRERFLLVWVVIGLAILAFLVGLIKLPHVRLPKQVGKGRGVILAATAAAVLFLILGLVGRPLGELEAFLPPSHSDWIPTYQKGQQLAQTTGKPMFINFTGVTCTNCRWMEKNMFPRDDIAGALKDFVRVELYTDRQTAEDQANQKRQLDLTGTVTLPEYVILSPDGKLLDKFESSTRDTQEFLKFIDRNRSRVARS